MAGRPLGSSHDARTRQKIQTSQLINRLANHAFGKNKMTSSQIKAAEILLRKSLPDLSAVSLTGEDGGPIQAETSVDFSKATAEQLRAIAALAVDSE